MGELGRAEHVQHSFHVVGQRRQADLDLCARESPQQEARMSEAHVLQHGERALDGTPSESHRRCRRARVHPLQRTFMDVALYEAAPPVLCIVISADISNRPRPGLRR